MFCRPCECGCHSQRSQSCFINNWVIESIANACLVHEVVKGSGYVAGEDSSIKIKLTSLQDVCTIYNGIRVTMSGINELCAKK